MSITQLVNIFKRRITSVSIQLFFNIFKVIKNTAVDTGPEAVGIGPEAIADLLEADPYQLLATERLDKENKLFTKF